MTAREDRRDHLHDLLIANPAGVTVDTIQVELGINHPTANAAIRDLRLHLGEYDTDSLVCNPPGDGRSRWVYQLVGDLAGARPWVRNRLDDSHSRLETIESTMASLVKGTSGRTREGRKARVIERALRRLREDLTDIDLDGVAP